MVTQDARQVMLDASLRYDLVVDGDVGLDNGANLYLNNAQTYLDRRVVHPQLFRSYYVNVAVGGFFFDVPELLHLEDLTFTGPENEKSTITNSYREPDEFWYNNPNDPAGWASQAPCEWTQINAGLSSKLQKETSSSFSTRAITGAEHASFGKDFEGTRIVLDALCDKIYSFNVYGQYLSPRLEGNEDVTFWTRNPMILGLAGALMLELTMNNRAGVAARLDSLNLVLQPLEDSGIEHAIYPQGTRLGGR